MNRISYSQPFCFYTDFLHFTHRNFYLISTGQIHPSVLLINRQYHPLLHHAGFIYEQEFFHIHLLSYLFQCLSYLDFLTCNINFYQMCTLDCPAQYMISSIVMLYFLLPEPSCIFFCSVSF